MQSSFYTPHFLSAHCVIQSITPRLALLIFSDILGKLTVLLAHIGLVPIGRHIGLPLGHVFLALTMAANMPLLTFITYAMLHKNNQPFFDLMITSYHKIGWLSICFIYFSSCRPKKIPSAIETRRKQIQMPSM